MTLLNVLSVLNVLDVLKMPKDPSLACCMLGLVSFQPAMSNVSVTQLHAAQGCLDRGVNR